MNGRGDNKDRQHPNIYLCLVATQLIKAFWSPPWHDSMRALTKGEMRREALDPFLPERCFDMLFPKLEREGIIEVDKKTKKWSLVVREGENYESIYNKVFDMLPSIMNKELKRRG